MPISPPRLSIIIVCRNAGSTIGKTLASIRVQSIRGMEVIIVDGASADSTREVVDSFRDIVTRFVSEPDTGVYPAMNKGIALSSGEWLLFMGANDVLAADDVIEKARPFLDRESGGVLCGEAEYSDGRVWRAPVSPIVRYRNFMHHQSSFYRRSLFAREGYDESLRIQADYDLNLRLWCRGTRPVPLPVRVALCETGGLSDAGKWANYHEEIIVRHRHFSGWSCWLWDFAAVARYLRKRLVRAF